MKRLGKDCEKTIITIITTVGKLYEKVQFPFGVLKGHRASPDVSLKVPFGSPVEKKQKKNVEKKVQIPDSGRSGKSGNCNNRPL